MVSMSIIKKRPLCQSFKKGLYVYIIQNGHYIYHMKGPLYLSFKKGLYIYHIKGLYIYHLKRASISII